MTTNSTPDWIKKIHLPIDSNKEYPSEIDPNILLHLKRLSLDELNVLADKSGVRDHLGVLTPSEGWSRDQYIETLSDISEMTKPQVNFIYSYLNITTKN